MLTYLLAPTACTLFLDGKITTIPHTVNYWDRLTAAIRAEDLDTLRQLVAQEEQVRHFCQEAFRVENGQVYYQNEPLNTTLTQRIIQMRDEGFDISPMQRFVENLMENPSRRAIYELYSFLEECNLPITDDGHFIAYKRIRNDWMDVYSGTIDNHIGQKPSLPRRNVDDDCRNTCSYGLHVCSLGYLAHYSGERLIAVKVNPKNVVSVPVDYHNSKMRVCEYEVITELDLATIDEYHQKLASVWSAPQNPTIPTTTKTLIVTTKATLPSPSSATTTSLCISTTKTTDTQTNP